MKLKVHDKKISDYSEIDKIIFIPKKISDEFVLGENSIKIDGIKFTLRVYDLLCDCNKQMHTHRVVDLRDVWEDLNLVDGKEVEIER
jgi:hypothetical protein